MAEGLNLRVNLELWIMVTLSLVVAVWPEPPHPRQLESHKFITVLGV